MCDCWNCRFLLPQMQAVLTGSLSHLAEAAEMLEDELQVGGSYLAGIELGEVIELRNRAGELLEGKIRVPAPV